MVDAGVMGLVGCFSHTMDPVVASVTWPPNCPNRGSWESVSRVVRNSLFVDGATADVDVSTEVEAPTG